MPYYDGLRKRLEELEYWADLRHEQGADVRPLLLLLETRVAAARRKISQTRPDPALAGNEPDDFAAIRALRPRGPRKLVEAFPGKGLKDRLLGAWLARAAGCTLGVPVEQWAVDAMEGLAKAGGAPFPPTDYWPMCPAPSTIHYGVNRFEDYLRGKIRAAPVDDDLAYTQLGLLILETCGPAFTTADVAQAWLKWLPIACTAEEVTLRNLKKGLPASKAGEMDNPFVEWIGADIRSDPWGYAAPGWPERAAEMAYRDAILSHRRNGVYGAMFFAATIAAALVLDDPIEAARTGLTEIPKHCRLAHDIRWALRVGPNLTDWREARALVDRRFKGMHAVHTNNNACLTIFGLILGAGDVTRTLGITVAMGLDNDCTAATAGSILGAIRGQKGIPAHWWKPFRNRARSYLNGHTEFKNSEIAARFFAVARRVWETSEEQTS